MNESELKTFLEEIGFVVTSPPKDFFNFENYIFCKMEKPHTFASSKTIIHFNKNYLNEYTKANIIEKIMNDTFNFACEYRKNLTIENLKKII